MHYQQTRFKIKKLEKTDYQAQFKYLWNDEIDKEIRSKDQGSDTFGKSWIDWNRKMK